MKKLAYTSILIVLFSLLLVTTVSAKAGAGNPTGEIKFVDEGTETLILDTGEGTILVYLPEEFDYESVAVGMIATVKGTWIDETSIEAEWVKDSADIEEPDPEDVEEGGEGGEGDGNAWAEGGVYCADGKEDVHPIASIIAEKYGVSEEFVMGYVCDGLGFGGVMLALQMGGEDAAGMLEQRKAGVGWGQIWKEMGLIGNESGDSPPPGHLKKPEKPGKGPPEGKGPNK